MAIFIPESKMKFVQHVIDSGRSSGTVREDGITKLLGISFPAGLQHARE
jgi:hypothetical protein